MRAQEFLEAVHRAILAHPQQPSAAGLDLIDQRQELAALPDVDLVDADGAQRPEFAMLQPPLHDILHRMTDLIPGRAEAQRRLLPRQLARPVRQVQHVGLGQAVLAHRPGHRLDQHAAPATLHAPHGIQQHHGIAPDRDELKAPHGQHVVSGPGSAAA